MVPEAPEATLGHYLAMIDDELAAALTRARKAIGDATAAFDGANRYGSRRTLYSLEAAEQELDAGIIIVLDKLDWAIPNTFVQEDELREHTERRLWKFTDDVKAAVTANSPKVASENFAPHFAKLDQRLNFRLEQHQVRLHKSAKKERPQMTDNSVKVLGNTGNVQVYSPGASQSFSLNIETAKTALDAFEVALKKIEIENSRLKDIEADVVAIRAQLSKSSPSLSILRELAQSLRKITENVVVGVITHPLAQAVTALGVSLGLTP